MRLSLDVPNLFESRKKVFNPFWNCHDERAFSALSSFLNAHLTPETSLPRTTPLFLQSRVEIC